MKPTPKERASQADYLAREIESVKHLGGAEVTRIGEAMAFLLHEYAEWLRRKESSTA